MSRLGESKLSGKVSVSEVNDKMAMNCYCPFVSTTSEFKIVIMCGIANLVDSSQSRTRKYLLHNLIVSEGWFCTSKR